MKPMREKRPPIPVELSISSLAFVKKSRDLTNFIIQQVFIFKKSFWDLIKTKRS